MRIRQRLALRFTLVSALVTGSIILLIYLITRGFVHADFVERLAQQSSLDVLRYATPQARDVVSEDSYLLVNPLISIFSTEGELLQTKGDYPIPTEWILELQNNISFTTESGEYTTVGRKFTVLDKTYLVFVSGKDLPGQHELDILIKAMFVGWLVSLLFSYLAGLYFSSDALRPVKRVVGEVNKITKDNLGYRLEINKNPTQADEIDELILTFNALLSRIETAFIAQKRLVQNASHELKTPLTAIMAEAELALVKSRSAEEYKRTLEVILAETERLERTTKGLLTLTRLEEGLSEAEIDEVNLNSLLEQTLSTFKLHHPTREVSLTGGFNSEAIVDGNEPLLQITFLNLLDNAVKYSTGKIIVERSQLLNEAIISVQDFGFGIPEKELSRIMSPLFRGSNATSIPGAGLGLPLVNRIIKVHNGKFLVNSKEGEGTKCIIHLPLAKSPN